METASHEGLLRVALRDLREGREVIAHRLPEVTAATDDPATRQAFERLVANSTREMATLADMLHDPEGEPNLWASGIMDDACRDVESNAAGSVRDVALIGAIRKFLAADIVSLETAICLSRQEGDGNSEALQALCQNASDLDHLLRRQLQRLTGQALDNSDT
jgi:ferritin-like metal-binding protein YciE